MRILQSLWGKKARSRSSKDQAVTSANDSVRYAYIHIGKTGGTSVGKLSKKANDAGYETPKALGHDTQLKKASADFPNALFSFTIRDPIERMISAFDSRMRQSRPAYTALWKTEEAVCYLWFPTSFDFFKALLSEDEREKSAGLFALHNLGHIRRGYRYHFGSVASLRSLRDRIYYIGELEAGSAAHMGYFEPTGVPDEFLETNQIHAHSGGGSTTSSKLMIPVTMLTELKDYFSEEYEVYEELKHIAKEQ